MKNKLVRIWKNFRYSNLPKILLITTIFLSTSYLTTQLARAWLIPSRDTLKVGLIGQPRRLNPLYSTQNPVDETLTKLIYRSAIKYDQNNKPVGDLLESWELSDDQTTYTLRLKKGLAWQDAKPITAKDLIFTYSLTQKENYQGPAKPLFEDVGFEEVDKHTIKIQLKEPFAPFLETLTFPILPEHIWKNMTPTEIKNSPQNLDPVGSTIYRVSKLEADDTIVQSLTLEEIDATTVKTQYRPHKLRFRFYTNSQQLTHAFKRGEIDVFFALDSNTYSSFNNWPNVTQSTQKVCGEQLSFFFNHDSDSKYSLTNSKLKQAIYQSLRSEAQADAQQYSFNPLPERGWAFFKTDSNEQTTLPQEDIQEIFSQQKQQLTILAVDHPRTRLLLGSLLNPLLKKGLDLSVKTVEPPLAENQAFTQRRFHIFVAPQKLGYDPDQYSFWHSSQTNLAQGGLNISGYTNRQVDKALEDGRAQTKLEKRKSAYRIFQQKLITDKPVLAIRFPVYTIARKNVALDFKTQNCLWQQSDFLPFLLQ